VKRREDNARSQFSAAEYPALREFLSAYLHEDFLTTYGSAASAAEAFCKEATSEERNHVRKEWGQLKKRLEANSLAAWQQVLRELGAAWQPQSEADLGSIGLVLDRREKG
jgi:CdiI immunity protein